MTDRMVRLPRKGWHIHLRPDPKDPNRDIQVRCNAGPCWYPRPELIERFRR